MAGLSHVFFISSLGLIVIRKLLCQFRLIYECKTLIEPFNYKNGIWDVHPLDIKVDHLRIFEIFMLWLEPVGTIEVKYTIVIFKCIFKIWRKKNQRKTTIWNVEFEILCEIQFSGLCVQEDVTSQLCLLPTDGSFVNDVLCCFMCDAHRGRSLWWSF